MISNKRVVRRYNEQYAKKEASISLGEYLKSIVSTPRFANLAISAGTLAICIYIACVVNLHDSDANYALRRVLLFVALPYINIIDDKTPDERFEYGRKRKRKPADFRYLPILVLLIFDIIAFIIYMGL